MKHIPYYLVAGLMMAVGCGNNNNKAGSEAHDHEHTEAHAAHDHEGHDHDCDSHDHEGHNHEAEGHSHDHEGHSHDAHNHEGHSHDSHDEHAHEPGVVEFTEERAKAAGLETEIVKGGVFSAVIRTSGEILPAQGDETAVVATTSGVITLGDKAAGNKSRLLPGSRVAEGQAIAVISAKNMADGDPVAKSAAAYEAAKKEFERAESLIKVNAISQKAYDQAKKEYETAKAEYDAYASKAGAKGLSLMSPMTGYVKEVLVNEGDYVTSGQPVAIVSQNRRLQLRADLPEKYWASANRIIGANFRPSYSEETYSVKNLGGRMISAGRSAAQGSFYIPVIFEFNNTGNFIPGAFCEVYLIEGQKENIISVPETALIEEQGVYSVYVKICKTEYRKQEVKIGESDGLRREILKGLNEGDEVVTVGAYQVKLASVASAIPGHSHEH